MQTENLKNCFFVGYVVTCHLTTCRVSRNRLSAIIFHELLDYCGIFLTRFLICFFYFFFYFNIAAIAFCFLTKRPQSTIVRNGSSNLHRVFLTSHTGCQYWIINAQYSRNNWQLCTLSVLSSFNRYMFILLTKMRTGTKTVLSTWYIFNVQGCTHADFYMCLIWYCLH